MGEDHKRRQTRPILVALCYYPVLVSVSIPVLLLLGWPLEWLINRLLADSASSDLAYRGTMNLLSAVVALAITAFYLRWGAKSRLADLGLPTEWPGVLALPAGLAIAMASYTLLTMTVLVSKTVVITAGRIDLWAVLAAVGISAGIGVTEEVICRGVLLQWLERAGNRWIAILFSTGFFVARHIDPSFALERWLALVGVASFGLLAAAAYYGAGRNLWLPIGLHWGYDLASYFFAGLPLSEERQVLFVWQWTRGETVGGLVQWDLFQLVTLAPIGFALVVWWTLRRSRVGEDSEGTSLSRGNALLESDDKIWDADEKAQGRDGVN